MNATVTTNELERATEELAAIRHQVTRAYVGGSEALEQLLVALLASGHVLIEGVPGVAKTTLAKAFAKALGMSMRRIQFTPDLLPADITGTYVLDPRTGAFELRTGPLFSSVVLADEINRAPAKTQSALLEAMAEGQVTIEGERKPLPEPFIVLATQNPVELEGTYPLPEAQLDRFLLRLVLGYPEVNAELAMLRAYSEAPPSVEAVSSPESIRRLQRLAAQIHVEPEVHRYIVELARFTRKHPKVRLGASPRASLALLFAAKASALLAGRPYASPEDVRVVSSGVLGHRLILVPEYDGDESARESILREALDRVPYSRAVAR